MRTCVALLPDYASEGSDNIPLHKVGINNVPMWRDDFDGSRVLTNQAVYVSLDGHNGIHMSRLVEAIMEYDGDEITADDYLLEAIAASHEVDNAYWECKWNSMWELDGIQSIKFGCNLEGTKNDGNIEWYLTTVIPYASVCPCSAAMVKETHGIPHMQRATAKITGRIPNNVDLGELMVNTLISALDAVGLVPKPLMKRPDELEWCQQASSINLFVEDAARVVSSSICNMYPDYVVVCEHEESIHQHNAVAICRKGEKLL